MDASGFPACCAMSCVTGLWGPYTPTHTGLRRNFISIHQPCQKLAYDALAREHTLLSVTKVKGNDAPYLAVCIWKKGK